MKPNLAMMVRNTAADRSHFPVLAGNSVVAHAMRQMVQLSASVVDPLLILGPEGSGKAAVAHAVHMLSGLSDASFLSFDCTDISEEERSQIFSTGLGWPHAQFHGTIYLDEVGLLPLDLQHSLRAWIENNEAQNRPLRLIAASRHSLDKLVAEKLFDAALCRILEKLIIPTQPLSRRRHDIRDLIMAMWANDHAMLPPTLGKNSWALLEENDWHGNFAEMQRVARMMGLSYGGKKVAPEQVRRLLSLRSMRGCILNRGDRAGKSRTEPLNLTAHLEREEAILLVAALERGGGAIRQAAKLVGIDRDSFCEKMRHHGIAFE